MGRPSDDAADREQVAAELDAVRPYLDLAKEIQRQVERFAADDAAEVESLVQAIDAIPRRERARVARAIFDRLPAEQQWTIVERVFGDEEISTYLAEVRDQRLQRAREGDVLGSLARAARATGHLDTAGLPPGTELTLGLFRPQDVRAAVARGRDSAVCARRLVLRATAEPGAFRVVEDVFNPRRGLFVTADYDERVWSEERLSGHRLVRVGSLVDEDGMTALQSTLYPGARVDLQPDRDGAGTEGRLHLGYAVVGDEDVFAHRS